MKKKLIVKAYTDGACSQNPGAGGWAALLLIKDSKRNKETVTIKGGEKKTTNNRMELSAVLEVLTFVNKNLGEFEVKLEILCDSAYVVDSINNGSLYKWENNGWLKVDGTSVANQDLWKSVLPQLRRLSSHTVTKVKGHSDNKFNNYADSVAVDECSKYKKLLSKF